MYFLGIDAGGTKTDCVITNEADAVLGKGFGGSANYQTCGIEVTRVSLLNAIHQAIDQAGILIHELTFAVFGMSGADDDSDLAILEPMCSEIMGSVPFKIINDCWIALRSGSPDYTGVISICGTGSGHAGRNVKGETCILRNMDYMLGNRGGGGELVEEVLHYAFRSDEGSGSKTILEAGVSKLFEEPNMEGVYQFLRNHPLTDEQKYQLPILVFEAARAGDEVAKQLIEDMARNVGQLDGAVIKKLGLCDQEVPLITVGSLFKINEPLMMKPYLEAVQKVAPKAVIKLPIVPPVMGAVALAREWAKV